MAPPEARIITWEAEYLGTKIGTSEVSPVYLTTNSTGTSCSSHGFVDASLHEARLKWSGGVPVLVYGDTPQEVWHLVPSPNINDFIAGNTAHHSNIRLYTQVCLLAHSMHGSSASYSSILSGGLKYYCCLKEGGEVTDTDEIISLYEHMYLQMWRLTDQDLDMLESLHSRMALFVKESKADEACYKGRRPKNSTVAMIAVGGDTFRGVLDDTFASVFVQFSPKQRELFFKDIANISNEDLDYILDALKTLHNTGDYGLVRRAKEVLTDNPVYEDSSYELEGSPFNSFLKLSRGRSKKHWHDYLEGSYTNGFDAIKGYCLPDAVSLSGMDKENKMDIESMYIGLENLFNKAPPFPKLPRYDLTPFQAACLFSALSEDGSIDRLTRKPKIPLQWIWDPNLEEKVKTFLRSSVLSQEKIFSLLQSCISRLVKGWIDSIHIYETYKEVAPVKPMTGYLDNLERISGWNHLQEGKIPVEVKVKMLCGNEKDDLAKPTKPLPNKIEKYRVKSSAALITLGKMFHHCIGSQAKNNFLFFNHGTVCAKTDVDFTRVLECRDAHNLDTPACRRFHKFLLRATGVAPGATPKSVLTPIDGEIAVNGELRYLEGAIDDHITTVNQSISSIKAGLLRKVTRSDGTVYTIIRKVKET